MNKILIPFLLLSGALLFSFMVYSGTKMGEIPSDISDKCLKSSGLSTKRDNSSYEDKINLTKKYLRCVNKEKERKEIASLKGQSILNKIKFFCKRKYISFIDLQNECIDCLRRKKKTSVQCTLFDKEFRAFFNFMPIPDVLSEDKREQRLYYRDELGKRYYYRGKLGKRYYDRDELGKRYYDK